MTRFARAKGSKADNERRPQEATAWSEVKKQLQVPGGKEQQQGNKKRRHYNPEDEDDDFVTAAINDSGNSAVEAGSGDEAVEEETGEPEPEQPDSDGDASGVLGPDKLVEQEDDGPKKKKKFMRSGKCLNCKEKGHLKMDCPKLTEERRKELQDLFKMKTERKGKGTGRKKTGEPRVGKKRKLDGDGEHDNKAGKYVKTANGWMAKDESPKVNNKKEQNKDTAKSKKDRKKSAKDQEGKRTHKKERAKKDKAGADIGDGEGLFHGFRVRKEDVAVLRNLAKKLNESGMGKEEVKETLKRERRRAEKALARRTKHVCFNCRQPGHDLAECPQASSGPKKPTAASSGKICFKCGSNEHTSRDCESRLKGADAFAFATCFICKETGHLAKACPDNPKGIYPKGGSCGICGSVEHLKSACPRKKEKDEKGEMRLGTIGKGSVDDQQYANATANTKSKKKPKTKKVVSF